MTDSKSISSSSSSPCSCSSLLSWLCACFESLLPCLAVGVAAGGSGTMNRPWWPRRGSKEGRAQRWVDSEDLRPYTVDCCTAQAGKESKEWTRTRSGREPRASKREKRCTLRTTYQPGSKDRVEVGCLVDRVVDNVVCCQGRCCLSRRPQTVESGAVSFVLSPFPLLSLWIWD